MATHFPACLTKIVEIYSFYTSTTYKQLFSAKICATGSRFHIKYLTLL